jgi:alkylresorcinol/alkylpyrone synthase
MQVVFDKRIPDIVAANAADELTSFLAKNHLSQNQIKRFLYHPGGMKVIQAYEAAYHTDGIGFELTRAVLRDYGTMSSVTVLFVLARYLDMLAEDERGYSVVSALGPGFCSEWLLLKS